MKYMGTLIAVRDVHASRKFYQDLFGLEVYQDYGANVAFTCGLSLQQNFGHLAGFGEDKVQWKAHNMELYFEEARFDEFAARVKARPGVQVMGEVRHAWGQRVIRFYDPDGHIIEVGEPLAAVVRSFLRQGMTMDQVSQTMDVSVGDLAKLLE